MVLLLVFGDLNFIILFLKAQDRIGLFVFLVLFSDDLKKLKKGVDKLRII